VASGKLILTVGHSNHEERRFLELLAAARIGLIADVRANPRSRYPQFNRSAFAASLEGAGVGYAHLGDQLGGRREPSASSANTGWEEGPFRGYADHMGSAEFAAGLERIEELATRTYTAATKTAAGSPATNTAAGYTAVMCAEADWRHCHRRLIADVLLTRGWKVLHLDGNGLLENHELTEFARVDRGRVTYPERQTSLDLEPPSERRRAAPMTRLFPVVCASTPKRTRSRGVRPRGVRPCSNPHPGRTPDPSAVARRFPIRPLAWRAFRCRLN